MNTNLNETESLACDLTAIPADVRGEHIVSASQLFSTAQEVQELPDGYAIRFANEPGKFMDIANFIEHDRLCCPFFNFGVEVEPNSGPLWLRLTGGEGVKELVQTILFESIEDKEALKQVINTGGDPELDKVVSQIQLTGFLKQASSG